MGSTYREMFKAGDVVRVQLDAITLAQPRIKDAPYADYHGMRVTVTATKERSVYPDSEGMVDCLLPFPIEIHTGNKENPVKHIWNMPFLYSMLSKEEGVMARRAVA